MNNIFVKDAISAKDKLTQYNKQKQKYITQVNNIVKSIQQIQHVKDQLKQYDNKVQSKSNKYQTIVLLQKKKKLLQAQQIDKQKQLQQIEKKITQYNNNQTNILNNKQIEQKIILIVNKLEQNQREYNKNKITVDNNNLQSGILLQKNIQLQKQIVKINQLQIKYNLYSKYIQAMHKNGIPLRLIQSSIPLIQTQTNNILSLLTQFTLQFQINQSSIDILRVYDLDNKLPVQLGSGFQQTVSDISSRIALSKISNAPRSNIVIIDQNFGALDSNNIMKVQGVLQYLKQYYQYVLIISHIDILKGMVDDSITVIKDGQFSYIR